MCSTRSCWRNTASSISGRPSRAGSPEKRSGPGSIPADGSALHRGVYATFSGPRTRLAQIWAAWLSCGPTSAVSHATAAELLGLSDEARPEVHITVPDTRRIAPRSGVIIHQDRHVATKIHPARLPRQTRVEHTVFDLINATDNVEEAFGWLAAACGRRLTNPGRLVATLAERPKTRWRRDVSDALSDVAAGCHSPLELRYLRDVERRHRLPRAERQSVGRLGGGRIYHDVRYRDFRTIVELDGRLTHPFDKRFRDLRRDNAAAVNDERLLRYGWGDVWQRPCEIAAQVASVLIRQGWPGSARPCGGICVIQER